MNDSTEHLTGEGLTQDKFSPQYHRWSASTSATGTPDMEKVRWEPPPIPPIPTERQEEAWRRRSRQRCSYTEQMTGKRPWITVQALDADSGRKARPPSSYSATTSARSATVRRDMHADLHWEINALNPLNWRKRRKWYHTFAAGMDRPPVTIEENQLTREYLVVVTFTATFASSVVALAQPSFSDENDVSSSIAILPLALFVAGLACGPLLSGPLSDRFGRKLVYTTCLPLFAVFTLVAGFVRTPSGFFVIRFFAGLSAGPAVAISAAVLSDVWSADEISMHLALWCIASIAGPAMGMILGGYIVQVVSLRWTQFVVLFACALCLPVIFTISETSRRVILRRKHGPTATIPDAYRASTIARTLAILFTDPTTFFVCVHMACSFAVIYAAFAAFPTAALEDLSGSLGLQGLSFVSMMFGALVGLAAIAILHLLVYKPCVVSWKEQKAADAEKATAQKRRTTRASRATTTEPRPDTRRSNTTVRSHPDPKRDSHRHSLALSLKRVSTGRPRSSVSAQQDPEKNIALAVAAADYLNNVPANLGKRIMPERIILILNKNQAFGDLCAALEAYHLRLDPVQFAKVLVDAMPSSTEELADGSTLARSRSLHRNAAAAALNTPAPKSQRSSSAKPTLRPPTKWRLWLALPGSILTTGSLFLIGWGSTPRTSIAVPIAGMAILAVGVTFTVVSSSWYLFDRYGSRDGPSALAASLIVRYLLSFAFVMFALPLYDRLGTAWGTSVLGFISGVTIVIPCMLLLRKDRSIGM